MFAKKAFLDYVHPGHFMFFVEAAAKFHCHILIRKTGEASLSWIGKRGYTGKRGDLKAKTADVKVGRFPVAGLVCSPLLRPESFSPDRRVEACQIWMQSRQLITEPRDTAGFDDQQRPSRCTTPYLVQTNPNHPHHGCVALVESGLLVPRYVHGDYDLFAIIPAGHAFDADAAHSLAHERRMGTTVAQTRLGLAQREARSMANMEGPLTFNVANFINSRIAMSSPDLLGALMINHGEDVNHRKMVDGEWQWTKYVPVLAIMPGKNNKGDWGEILETKDDHLRFYANA